uniref:Protein kinase domain-containing protein n=1 Tax=Meloidogyne hapla TaxID=6305 RepID=A0A1I8BNR1_MELHA
MVLQTALNYLSQASSQFVGQSDQHNLIGQTIEVGNEFYTIRSLIAEGGFALVFAVQDTRIGEWFALKRQLAHDKTSAESISREIRFMKHLNGHPAILHFVHSTQLDGSKTLQKQHQYYAEFLILTELCSGGPLIDYLQKMELSTEQVCKIFYSTCSAVQHMHDRNPPISHRDIKIENLLFDARGFLKLCDFGSATTDIYRPKDDWNALMRSQLEDEMSKHTTPMYRAPEILETYQNYPIGPAQDIWVEDIAMALSVNLDEPVIPADKLDSLIPKDEFSASTQSLAKHLKTQLGFDSSQSDSVKTDTRLERKVTPPRPPAPASLYQTKTVQLTHEDHQLNLHPKLEAASTKGQPLTIREKKGDVLIPAWEEDDNILNESDLTSTSSLQQKIIDVPTIENYTSNINCSDLLNEFNSIFPPTLNQNFINNSPKNKSIDDLLNLVEKEITPTIETAATIAPTIHYNKSTPDFLFNEGSERINQTCTKSADDILAEFLSEKSVSSNIEIPSTSKPDYSSIHFTKSEATTSENVKLNFDAFDDLLSAQGFISTAKQSNKTLSDMAKERDAKEMDPLTLKIKDWTDGKQRNIRALLGSLSQILWDEAKVVWQQPSVAELFAQDKVKKYYRKACLVVHPDKQAGTINEPLAKAVFTELNDAWNEFTKTAF